MNASALWKSVTRPERKKPLRYAALVLALTGGVSQAQEGGMEREAAFHGFASFGYVATSGNHFYGETRGGGDVDYYELGLNGFLRLHPRLSASGQVLARKAGETDDGKPRLDYAFLDYQLPAGPTARYGVRLGRVRNPLGFYNESRDVVFTRPSILLPQSVYLEGTGVRELVFSSDGGQFYSDWDHANSHTSARLTLAMDRDVSEQSRRNLLGDTSSIAPYTPTGIKMRRPLFGQVLHEIDGGRLRLALSFLDTRLTGQLVAPALPSEPVSISARMIILSAQYNAEDWTLTSEYSLTSSRSELFGMRSINRSDGVYLQYQYRFSPEWSGLLRQDLSYPDRNDRGSNVSRDTTVGLIWSPRPEWLVSGEFHRIAGTGGVPVADNRGLTLAPRTDLFALMLGYRF